MGSEASSPNNKLRIFFFPYMAAGHFIPMLNMAKLFSNHPSVSATIITTPSNAHLITSSSSSNLSLLLLPLPPTSLPNGWDSISLADFHSLPSALSLLRHPLLLLLRSQPNPPHCLISDMFLPWTADVAADLNIPRLVFHGMSFYSLSVIDRIKYYKPQDLVADDSEPFVVPGLPHPVEMIRAQLPAPLRSQTQFNSLMDRMAESEARSYGVVVNSFYELEPEFAEHYRNPIGKRAWHVGPVSLQYNGKTTDVDDHGGYLAWLDSKKRDSVIYVCFGSQARFTASQLSELAMGLASSKHNFIWVVRQDSPEIGLEKEVEEEKGLIIRGWAPQVQILSHESVGGFLTHCGWNSVLEGVSAGKPMATWPVFGDQSFNEKLVVDELGIGVRVGVEIGIGEEEETVVRGGEIKKAVEKVMGEGEEAAEMRRRARRLGDAATEAVEEGGSSRRDMDRLIEELMVVMKKDLRV